MGSEYRKDNGKRRTAFGLCAGILVGIFAVAAYAGCAGDCYTCHKKLQGDKNHLVLGTCIKCHNPSTQKLLSFNAKGEGCGENCFDCHKQWPLDGNHAPLNNCQDCHKKSKK